jgi:carboxyl-terminal processing protease
MRSGRSLQFRGCLLALVSLVACGGPASAPSAPTPAPQTGSGMSQAAKTYLDQLLGIMQGNSINRSSIDWTSFQQMVYQAAGNAQSIADTDSAISTALGLLGDHHSFFIKNGGAYIYNPNPLPPCTDPVVATPQVPAAVGYVRIEAFSSSSQSEWVDFAASIQNWIRASDSAAVQGWIVDLRGNSGGNMWAMIAGVGPILGEGTAGAFIDSNSQVTLWAYADGASLLGGAARVQVPTPYQLRRRDPRVAVLTDCRVASSGEAAAISFVGRPNTRFFGTPTRGLSTANAGYLLSDGAMLVLTDGFMADRNLTKYGRPVTPDEIIGSPDQVTQRAIDWLTK